MACSIDRLPSLPKLPWPILQPRLALHSQARQILKDLDGQDQQLRDLQGYDQRGQYLAARTMTFSFEWLEQRKLDLS